MANKNDVIKLLSSYTHTLTQEQAKDAINALILAIVDLLQEGEDILISGLGKFYMKEYRLPGKDHKKVWSPAFTFSEVLKETVRGKR